MAESLTDIAVQKLTKLIMSGEIEPETHLQEAYVADLLGMSRTPVRAALVALANGGLLVPGPWRGYKVRFFTLQEIGNAYAVRATLEGMVCRVLAETGLSDEMLADLRAILETGDQLFKSDAFSKKHLREWMRINDQFHSALALKSGNEMLRRMIELSQGIPIVHPGFVGKYQYNESFYNHLLQGQNEHYRLLRAIEHRQSARAEALMREHVIGAAEAWLASINNADDQDPNNGHVDLGKLSELPLDLRKLLSD